MRSSGCFCPEPSTSVPYCGKRKKKEREGCWLPPVSKRDKEKKMVAPMTSRQRVLAALRRQPVDRTPSCNPTSVATVELMDVADAPFPDANRQPELMARLAATGHTELGFDTIMPCFSIIQESSAIGCKIQWEQK